MPDTLYEDFAVAWNQYRFTIKAIEENQSLVNKAKLELDLANGRLPAVEKTLADAIAALNAKYGYPVPGPVSPPPPAPDPVPTDPSLALTKFKASDSIFQNYGSSIWHPIVGAQVGKLHTGTAFRYDALSVNADGELVHTLTNTDAAAIKWEAEKRKKKTQGHYITEATFDSVKPGVVYNPLWLFSEGDPVAPGHEFDFEYMNGRLEYNIHSPGGYLGKSVLKDLSGHRCRWEIIRRPGQCLMRVTSLTDGWTDELFMTPAIFEEWKATRPNVPATLKFPADTVAMFPVTELWIANQGWGAPNNIWSGKWVPLAEGESVKMILHGYLFQD